MSTLLQQLAYQYKSEKLSAGESTFDSGSVNGNANLQQQQPHQEREENLSASRSGTFPQVYDYGSQQRGESLSAARSRACPTKYDYGGQQRGESLSAAQSGAFVQEYDHVVDQQQRDNKMQLQQHERTQHLHQLQSINNLLLDTNKLPNEATSPTTKPINTGFENMSISDLFGLGLPRGSLMGAGQKEHGGQFNCDNAAYRNHQQTENDSAYYSVSDMSSSPISVHTPSSPCTPESLYSNSYSYSSVSSSSPYTSPSSVLTGYNKQFPSSPVRSPCYGRPIRGNTPYSDCSNSPVEFPSHVFTCNGSRSNSPADSESSVNSVDGPLSDIMNCLSFNSAQQQHRCVPPYPNSLLGAEKYLQNGAGIAGLPKLKKDLQNSQQHQQAQAHSHHHHHVHRHPWNHHYNQQQNGPYVNSNFGSEKGCCLGYPRNMPINSLPNPSYSSHLSLDKAAKYHRNAAAVSDTNFTWSGTLPNRTQKPIGYSSKVFLGGVPWDITESNLISAFKQFGQIKIAWPGKDQAISQPKGFVYIIFESEKQVKSLLSCCTHDFSNGGSYYYKISSKRMKGKQVQVIPWALNDSNYVKSSSQKLDPEKTVFVGALHGMINAIGLANIMNDLFDNVIYAGIDTDKHKYPIGSARVTFSSKDSFIKAVNAAFIEIKTKKFTKKVQIDPYIEDAPCSNCFVQQGPYFCRESTCFKYFCHSCWQWVHNKEFMSWHNPMSRGLKNNRVIGLLPIAGGTSRSTGM